ncbi:MULTISPECIES: ATP-binding protein [unclassified Lysobacter]|uniref:ATP-binding protein n=1 Tax=unclassified Lysobacter TaxID=2635362 RepID=UPI001BE7B72A|nr:MULTISPECIES: ATP-binding protein [unclassified Lysobacter]MBT2745885.1 hypothetical protein [Lysobacter sp. ISL-42]MBT2749556.1 hypothetical protein [Lysobacter sp. ISL-50]MBT2778800.1 hypothetical protein [Lysobacter sp. ISL-54]MBT2781396.1 hypothetical protein [Lysobacter sp. ISL-52]
MSDTMKGVRMRYARLLGVVAAIALCAAAMAGAAVGLIARDADSAGLFGIVGDGPRMMLIGAGLSLLAAVAYLVLGPLRRLYAHEREQAVWRELTEDALRAVPDGLFLIDSNFIIRDPVSPALLQVLQRKLWPGMDLIEVLRPMLAEETLEATRAYLKLLFAERARDRRIAARNPLAEVVFAGPPSRQAQVGFRFDRVERDGAAQYLLVSVGDIGERLRLGKELAGAKLRLRAQLEGLARALGHDSARIRACLNHGDAAVERMRVRLQRLCMAADMDERLASYRALIADAQLLKREAGEIDLDLIETPAHCFELDLVELSHRPEFGHEDARRLGAEVEYLGERIGTMRELLVQIDGRASAAVVAGELAPLSVEARQASAIEPTFAQATAPHAATPTLAQASIDAATARGSDEPIAADFAPPPASASASASASAPQAGSHDDPEHGQLTGHISIGGSAAAIAGGPERAAAFLERMQSRIPARVSGSEPPQAPRSTSPAPPAQPPLVRAGLPVRPVQTTQPDQPSQLLPTLAAASPKIESRPNPTPQPHPSQAWMNPLAASASTAEAGSRSPANEASAQPQASPTPPTPAPADTDAGIAPAATPSVESSPSIAIESADPLTPVAPITSAPGKAVVETSNNAIPINASTATTTPIANHDTSATTHADIELTIDPASTCANATADDPAKIAAPAFDNGAEEAFALVPLLALSGGDMVLSSSKAAFADWAAHARQLAGQQSKSVRVEAVLDLFEQLPEPTVAVLREVGKELVANAVTHGIESMSMRRRVGKDPVGVVRLALSREESVWQFVVRDDGRGINLVRLRAALLREGRYRIDVVSRMSERDAILKIFEPGVTTAASSEGGSGLGMGLPAAMERIRGLGARMALATVAGKSTELRIRWTQR